jgi:putative ABC transport system permease protein
MFGYEFSNAWRRLRARPAHTLLSTGILALGLASTLFLFGAVNGMVLRPLPFPHAERLVSIGWLEPGATDLDGFSADDWLRLRPNLSGFELIAVDGGVATINIARGDGVKRYDGALIDARMLGLLGEQPLFGRAFSDEDDRAGAPMTVLIGERAWRNDFNADANVVGQTLRINGEPATIIGVMPEKFRYPYNQEVWISRRLAQADAFDVRVSARLAADTTFEQAQLALESIGQRLGGELAESLDGDVLSMRPLAHSFVNEITRRMSWMMFAAGLLVLLLACANVANLQLAQVLTRRRELAVRSALGAGRRRLLRELMIEALLMSLMATTIAVVLSHYGGLWVMQSMIANNNLPAYYISFEYDWRDIGFIVVAAVAACLLAGLAPALRAAGTDVQEALRDGSKGSHGGFFARISRGLVVAEIALTVVLLVGAAMFVRGIEGMLRLDFGTDANPAHVLTGRVGVFPHQYPTGADQARFFQRVANQLSTDPQVLAASASTGLPGSSPGGDAGVIAEGQARSAENYVETDVASVDAAFADVYGLRLTAGRFIDDRDSADSLAVAVVDRSLVERLWPDRDPLGQRLRLGRGDDAPVLTVVGVVDDLRLRRPDDRSRPVVLRPMTQAPSRFATIAVRLNGDAAGFGAQLSEGVRAVDADTPAYWVRTQAEAIRLGRVGPVLLTQIFSGVGLLALLLAAAGLYGVLSFSVEQRTRELGIRRAVGARAGGVVQLVARRVAWQIVLGLAIGVALGLPWSAVLADPALNTHGYDPMIFGAVIALILGVAIVASLAPLRRALRVDPIIALRQD